MENDNPLYLIPDVSVEKQRNLHTG